MWFPRVYTAFLAGSSGERATKAEGVENMKRSSHYESVHTIRGRTVGRCERVNGFGTLWPPAATPFLPLPYFNPLAS